MRRLPVHLQPDGRHVRTGNLKASVSILNDKRSRQSRHRPGRRRPDAAVERRLARIVGELKTLACGHANIIRLSPPRAKRARRLHECPCLVSEVASRPWIRSCPYRLIQLVLASFLHNLLPTVMSTSSATIGNTLCSTSFVTHRFRRLSWTPICTWFTSLIRTALSQALTTVNGSSASI